MKSLDEQVAHIQLPSQSKEIWLKSKGSILEIAMSPSNVGVAPEGSRVDGGGINA